MGERRLVLCFSQKKVPESRININTVVIMVFVEIFIDFPPHRGIQYDFSVTEAISANRTKDS